MPEMINKLPAALTRDEYRTRAMADADTGHTVAVAILPRHENDGFIIAPHVFDELIDELVRRYNAHAAMLAALQELIKGITPDLDTKDCELLVAIARKALAVQS